VDGSSSGTESRPGPVLREGAPEDLPILVRLLADDPLGSGREDPAQQDLGRYRAAMDAIVADPNHRILVLEEAGTVVAMLQLSFLPHLTYEGGWRAQIEGVRVDRAHRSRGLGKRLMEAAIDRARARGCHVVQLTTDRRRPEALRFYEGLGFEATHHGMKLHLDPPGP
jgi:GNAT superfamily N-acetyltransferase